MKLAKLFFLSLTFLMFLFSNLFSQPKEIIELLNRNNHYSIPLAPEELDKMYSKYDFVKNSLFHNLPKTNIEISGVVDSVLVKNTNSPLKKYTYTYDSNGNMISYLYENWDGANWVNNKRYVYTYDSNGNMTSYFYESWYNTNWVNDRRYAYTYDSNGNMTLYLYERWNGVDWINGSRYTYTYNSNGNMTSYLNEDWNGANWVNDS
ncbi:MAG: hypothetical protein L3J41_07090, partial [Melioribacteraceae bacterium]|nr:hypothetical protein [Melioribacteraceae bacterium]